MLPAALSPGLAALIRETERGGTVFGMRRTITLVGRTIKATIKTC